MSLIKQLWLATAMIMLLAFGGSFTISSWSAREYLQQQLHLKNLDNAQSLALSLSQAADDMVSRELMISAQFDTGHYRYIRLTAPDGSVLVERLSDSTQEEAPRWFTRLLPIQADQGLALVSDGWNQIGTLSVASQERFAYKQLWDSTVQLFVWFSIGALLCGLFGSLLLRLITRPLSRVVSQAEALGERRFITIPEPHTREFRSLVRSMNKLSVRIKQMLEEESARLAQLQRDAHYDKVTGLLNRDPFMAQLRALLARNDESSQGSLLFIRLPQLAELNHSLGRLAIDQLLKRFGELLQKNCQSHPRWRAGRLNGSDLALLCPELNEEAADWAEQLKQQLQGVARELNIPSLAELPFALAHYQTSEAMPHLLSRTDTALNQATQEPGRLHLAPSTANAPSASLEEWRHRLETAFGSNAITLQTYPVRYLNGELIHREASARLHLPHQEHPLNAGQFMPWITRLGWGARFDTQVMTQAWFALEGDQPICVNLTPRAVTDSSFIKLLQTLLNNNQETAQRLWLEVPEYAAFQNLEQFRHFCRVVRPLGCHIGIEHVAQEVSQLGALHDLGIDYIKIDASLIDGIQNDTTNQVFVRGLCLIAHSIGLLAIAEGVKNAQELRTLEELGLDGATGPAIQD